MINYSKNKLKFKHLEINHNKKYKFKNYLDNKKVIIYKFSK